MTDREKGEAGKPGAYQQTEPSKPGGFRVLLTVALLVLLAFNLPSFFNQMANDALAANSYVTICPDEGNGVLEAMNDTGLFVDPVKDLFPLGHESASTGYVVPNVDCTFSHVVYETKLNPAAAKVNLASNGWVISEDSPGLFSAGKLMSDVTYTVTYPEVGDDATTAAVTIRGSR